MTKRLVELGAAVMTTLLALVVLWQFRVVVLYVLVSLMLAAALRPLTQSLTGRSLAQRAARILAYLAALTGIALLLFLALDVAIHEIQQLAKMVAAQDEWRLLGWLDGSAIQQALVARLPPPSQLLEVAAGDQGQLVLPAILGVTQSIGSVVRGMLVTVVLSIYWSLNQGHFERLWLSLLPSGQRKRARGVWRAIELDIGAYLRVQAMQSLLVGLLLGLVYRLLGSPYPVFLALLGALACLVPVVGVALAVLPVLLVGLLGSVQLSLLTALFTFVVMLSLDLFIKPLVYRRWDNPILTVILLVILADAYGLPGIIAAPLLSVVCQVLWRRLVIRRSVLGAAAQVSDLKEREAHLRDTIAAMEEPPPPLVTSSLERLTRLIEKAEPILQAELLAPSLAAEPSSPLQSTRPVVAGVNCLNLPTTEKKEIEKP